MSCLTWWGQDLAGVSRRYLVLVVFIVIVIKDTELKDINTFLCILCIVAQHFFVSKVISKKLPPSPFCLPLCLFFYISVPPLYFGEVSFGCHVLWTLPVTVHHGQTILNVDCCCGVAWLLRSPLISGINAMCQVYLWWKGLCFPQSALSLVPDRKGRWNLTQGWNPEERCHFFVRST